MSVPLKPEVEARIREKVSSGLYASPSEVVHKALDLLEERDQVRQARIEKLRAEIKKGLDDVATGRVRPLDIEEIKAEGRRRLAVRRRA